MKSETKKERSGSQIVKEECERAKRNILKRVRNPSEVAPENKKQKKNKVLQKFLHFFSYSF